MKKGLYLMLGGAVLIFVSHFFVVGGMNALPSTAIEAWYFVGSFIFGFGGIVAVIVGAVFSAND